MSNINWTILKETVTSHEFILSKLQSYVLFHCQAIFSSKHNITLDNSETNCNISWIYTIKNSKLQIYVLFHCQAVFHQNLTEFQMLQALKMIFLSFFFKWTNLTYKREREKRLNLQDFYPNFNGIFISA